MITVGELKVILDDYNDDKVIWFTYDIGGEHEKRYPIEESGTGYAEDEDGDRVEVFMLLAFSD